MLDFIPGRVYKRMNGTVTDYAVCGPKKMENDGKWTCWLNVMGLKPITIRSDIDVKDQEICKWELVEDVSMETRMQLLETQILDLSYRIEELTGQVNSLSAAGAKPAPRA